MGFFASFRIPGQLLLALAAFALTGALCGQTQPSTSDQATPAACDFTAPDYQPMSQSRSFHMGFSRWPPAANQRGISRLNKFSDQHADLTLIHMDSGVPWPAALAANPFSEHIRNDWQSNLAAVPPDHQLLVAITPLNMERDGLAKYRWQADNQPLPAEWKELPMTHPDVKEAYLNYAERALEFFSPDYFVVGIEVNLTLNASQELWHEYAELHRHVYENLKAKHPNQSIFASFTYPDMKGDRDDSADASSHQQAVAELTSHNDLLGLSVYPYSYIYGGDGSLPADYFDLAASYELPIAITESGLPSQAFTAYLVEYPFTTDHQVNYMQSLLEQADAQQFQFVANWAAIDFEELMEEIPFFLRDLARFWVYTGLETSDGCAKPALTIWDSWLDLPLDS